MTSLKLHTWLMLRNMCWGGGCNDICEVAHIVDAT